jgi:4-hydroxyphenylpyruvate dioxygenase-like putative hemolysin
MWNSMTGPGNIFSASSRDQAEGEARRADEDAGAVVDRFDLAPGLVDRLRSHNILYGRDEHGEFFQLYSRNFGEGFFFEIIERRGGYAGYGGPNAPFRIAAQKRTMPPRGMPKA